MTDIARRAVTRAAAVTVAAGVVLFVTSGWRDRVLDVYVVVLAAIVMLALVRVTRAIAPRRQSPFERAVARMSQPPATRRVELREERDVVLSQLNAFHYHVRVRPVLREYVAHRLRSRYGVDADAAPQRARELVPSRAWEVVRPDRRAPADRLARGPSLDEQRRVLDELETL